jgi:preprotein translocase subunit SecY
VVVKNINMPHDIEDCRNYPNILPTVVIIAVLTAGSALVMWLGEQIDKSGIGNGISMLLFAGIISRFPSAVVAMYSWATNGEYLKFFGTIVLFLVMVAFIVWMTGAERRIPVQYAKKVVGRKMYGGQNSHIPIKVNMSGVMPIIFASSILMLPTMILSFMGTPKGEFAITTYEFLKLFSHESTIYAIVYFLLIIGFAYFYATIQFNPQEMSNNLRKNGGAIPGIRPGQPTTDFISKILSRITLIGAIFLSIVALLPVLANDALPGISLALGGTSVLIMVGVALDTVRSLESQMMMRPYKGFLD